jgi:hypothetical protein
MANAKKIWSDVITNAPRDAAGNRLNILQSNPIGFREGVVRIADIAGLKLGVTGASPAIFRASCGKPDGSLCATGSTDRARQELYGRVPLQNQCESNLFINGYRATWTGIRNPFGYTAGQSVPIQLQHVAWYFGSEGVIPINSLIVNDDRIITDDWFPTFDRFGPNGTAALRWGQIPNYP